MLVAKIEKSVETDTILITLAQPAGQYIEIGASATQGDSGEKIAEMFNSDFMDMMSKLAGFPDAGLIEAEYGNTVWETMYTLEASDNVVQINSAR